MIKHAEIKLITDIIIVPTGRRSEGAGGELDGLRGAAASDGAKPSRTRGAHRHEATRGRAQRPGTGPRSGERTEPAEEEEQRAGGLSTDQGQSCLPAGTGLDLRAEVLLNN